MVIIYKMKWMCSKKAFPIRESLKIFKNEGLVVVFYLEFVFDRDRWFMDSQ